MSTRRRRQRSSLFPYTTLFRSMALLMMSLMRFSGRLRSHGKGFLPVVFGTGGQLLNPGQKSRHFPYVLLTQYLAPSRHAGVTNPGTDGVEDMPLRIVQRFENQLRRRRIEAALQRTALLVERSVTEGAVHGVKLHAIDQVGIGCGHRIIHS